MDLVQLKPVIAVIGQTGTGKSKLAIELAKRFSGQVLNADALQVYDTLPISTNKVTEEEMDGVPHHLMSFKQTRFWSKSRDVNQKDYTVVEFVRDAQQKIAEIHAQNQIPIVVGGTHYYIQSLLWQDEDLENVLRVKESPLEEGEKQRIKNILDKDDRQEIYATVQQIDPLILKRWHPNDIRKIKRSLEVYYETGQKHSELMKNQVKRYKKRYQPLIFCMYSENQYLHPRLDKRIDQMFERGLLNELEGIHEEISKSGIDVSDLDFSKGVLQSIGYKELHPYITHKSLLDEFDNEQDQSSQILENCIERMKINTKAYAKKQLMWIKHQLSTFTQLDDPSPFYIMDVKNASDSIWKQISETAQNITKLFLEKQQLPDQKAHNQTHEAVLIRKKEDEYKEDEKYIYNRCEQCQIDFYGIRNWKTHIESGRHKRKIFSLQKQSRISEFKKQRQISSEKSTQISEQQ